MRKYSFLLTFLFLIVTGKSLAQAPDILWISTYNGLGNGYDDAADCAADNQGNLYAVGSSFNGTNTDFIIIKYNTSNGDTIWTRRYNGDANSGDGAVGCVLDNSGNIYVVGFSNNDTNKDFIIIKYNTSSGDTIWTRTYNGAADGYDSAQECALDGSGNIYVTGLSHNGINFDYITVKYNVNGDTIWTRRYDGTANGRDVAYGCAVDVSGNIFVNGYSYNGVDYNLLTIRYDSNGDTTWTRRSQDTIDSLKYGGHSDCTVDGLGNIYVTGMCGIEADRGNRYSVTIKYDPSGNPVWTSIYDGPTSYDQSLGCALDGSGYLYVTGTCLNGDNGGNDDCFTIKYNSANGDTLWTTRYSGPANGGDYGSSCTVDASGYLYVTGTTQTDSFGFDCITIKYESTTTSIREYVNEIPISFNLEQNYPNPFNPITTFKYGLTKPAEVTLRIYNLLGRQVAELVNSYQEPGYYKIQWYASGYSSGIYFYKIQAGESQKVRKMVLMK
ncbi:T9SS type A sorting domain-containing protein [candidate division KSB1 bacterium]|nr:T9SS type A sorting domain-containing protein [candidate division KSB1 bacterium]